jgi:exopolysaccharide production protein ExoQ
MDRRKVMRDRPKAKSSDTKIHFPGRSVLAALPVFAYFYLLLILPFIGSGDGGPRIVNQMFWPTMAGSVLALAWVNGSLLNRRYIFSLPIMSLAAYLLFAAASIGWAYSPDYSVSRFFAQLFAVIVVVAPYALPISTAHTPQRLHVCCAIAAAVTAIYVLETPPGPVGHTGYFTDKQTMGMFCGTVIIISAHEILFHGWRRLMAVVVICVSVWLILESKSKGSLAFCLFSLFFSGLVLAVCKYFRTTPPFVLAAAAVLSSLAVSNPIESISYHLYGDFTVTGRTYIWNFINYQISLKPWVGWGFHSYWFVPNSPNNAAPGFVRYMPSSHSGYLELRLDTGYVGYFIFLVFVYSSLHSLEMVRRVDPARAWLYMSLACYVIFVNFIDSIWISGNDLWILYLIVVAESIVIAQSNRSVSNSRARHRLVRTEPQSSQNRLAVPAIGEVQRDVPHDLPSEARQENVGPVDFSGLRSSLQGHALDMGA